MDTATSPNKSSKPERNDAIDLFRILAVCGVIWFHLENAPYKRVGYAGLVYFLVVAIVFQLKSAGDTKGISFFKKRATRLLLPWAAWFFIYALLNIALGKALFPHSSGFLSNLLCGPWIGLWFLPFIYLSSGLTYCLSQIPGKLNQHLLFAIPAGISLIALIYAAMIRTSHVFDAPWAQWVHAVPSIPIGMTMAYALRIKPNATAFLVTYETSLLFVCLAVHRFDPGIAISYAIGTLMVTVGLLTKIDLPKRIGKLSSLCLGVYLIHGCVTSALKLIPWLRANHLAWFSLTLMLSFLISAWLKRTRTMRWSI